MSSLRDLTRVMRSKNAGVDYITLDFIFKDHDAYETVLASRKLSRAAVAETLGVDVDAIEFYLAIPAMDAIKFSVRRPAPCGSPGERDIYGVRQYAPFINLRI